MNCTLAASIAGAINARLSRENGAWVRSGKARRTKAHDSGKVATPKAHPSSLDAVNVGTPMAYKRAIRKVHEGLEKPSTRGPPA